MRSGDFFRSTTKRNFLEMPRRMIVKKTLLSCLALVLLAVGAPRARAQDDASDIKPVVVAAFSGYDELKRDLEYLGTLAGNPDMAQGLEQLLMLFTQNQGLAGLDPARPWGASISMTADGSQFPALVFLPVTNLQKLLDALSGIVGEAADAGDDIFEIKKGTNTFFITKKGKWAYLAQQKGAFEDLPGDPLGQLGDLHKKYDFAVSVHIQNIPQALRDMAADLLKQGLEAGLQQNLDEDDEQADLKAQVARNQAETIVKGINDIDQITVGLNIDREESRTYLDVAITAVEGSDTAKEFAAEAEDRESSRFSGVLIPDALLSLHINSAVSDEDEGKTEGLLENLRTQLAAEIDKEDDLDDDQKEKSKELAGKLFDIVEETIEEEGRLNAGLVVVGEGPVTLVLGALVADGAALEDVAKEFVTLAAKDASLSKLKLNVAKHKGHRFHALSAPVDEDNDNAEQLKQVLGDPVKIVMAFGKDVFYVAVGDDGIDTIKQVIDASAETPEEKLPPMTIALSLAPLLKLASSQRDNPAAAMMAESLKEGGKDHVKITLETIDNGVRYRIEGEEGINRLLGSSLGSGLQAGGAGGR
jgi:hypothetical protein